MLTFKAVSLYDGEIPVWCVEDNAGGRWWPSEEARVEIDADSDPSRRAIQIASEQPMRGEWKWQ